jgi:PHD/YefM family antitoxin component YafN of YafNO toxin-antitoxin module
MLPKPIGPTELRQNLYNIVREVSQGERQYLVTPSEGDAVLMLSCNAYNALVAERDLLSDLRKAEADIAAGRTYSSREVRALIGDREKRTLGARDKPR